MGGFDVRPVSELAYSAIVIGGGNGNEFVEQMGPKSVENMREQIRNGSFCLLICGGVTVSSIFGSEKLDIERRKGEGSKVTSNYVWTSPVRYQRRNTNGKVNIAMDKEEFRKL